MVEKGKEVSSLTFARGIESVETGSPEWGRVPGYEWDGLV